MFDVIWGLFTGPKVDSWVPIMLGADSKQPQVLMPRFFLFFRFYCLNIPLLYSFSSSFSPNTTTQVTSSNLLLDLIAYYHMELTPTTDVPSMLHMDFRIDK